MCVYNWHCLPSLNHSLQSSLCSHSGSLRTSLPMNSFTLSLLDRRGFPLLSLPKKLQFVTPPMQPLSWYIYRLTSFSTFIIFLISLCLIDWLTFRYRFILNTNRMTSTPYTYMCVCVCIYYEFVWYTHTFYICIMRELLLGY